MKRIKRFIHTIPLIMAVLVLISSFIVGGSVGSAYASASANGEYSEVLDDLHKDETFDMREYPAVDNDYSLQVIQIAESTAGELFIYVYQPSANVKPLTATTVRISQSIGENLSPQDFKLTLLNRKEVFAKYLVEGLVVKPDAVRYYDIIQICRPWEEFDKEANTNDINEVSDIVGKRFTACTVNGEVSYTCIINEVMEIIPETKHIGYVRYFEGMGFIISYSEADCWYVGFDTYNPLDSLYEVEMSFKVRTVERTYLMNIQSSERFGEWQSYENIKYDGNSKGSAGNGLFAQKYEWERIISKDDFVSKYITSETEKNNLSACKWVIRFFETERKTTGDYKTKQVTSSEISYVTILRLKFEYDGQVFNLGVVDNKTSPKPDQRPGNYDDIPQFDFLAWLEEVTGIPKGAWIAILCLIPIAIALPILSVIFPVVGKAVITAVKYVFIGIWWIISAPFKALYWLCKKIFRLED